MEKYLEKGEVSPDELHEPLERALREGHLIPVVFTSAKTGAGIGELLDVIVKLLPNPTEGNPPSYTVTKAGNGERHRAAAGARPGQARARARLQDRDRSLHRPPRRVPRAPGPHDRRACSSTSARAASRSSPATSTCCAARRRPRCTRRSRATSAPSPRSTRSSSTTSCTTRPRTRTCTPGRSSCRSRCSASRCSRRSAATSRKSPTCCTRSWPRIRASASSTTRRRTRP